MAGVLLGTVAITVVVERLAWLFDSSALARAASPVPRAADSAQNCWTVRPVADGSMSLALNSSPQLLSIALAVLAGTSIATVVLLAVRAYRDAHRSQRNRERVEFDLDRERLLSDTLIETNPSFVVTISPDGKLLRMNQSMLEALDYTKEEAIGCDYIDTFVPEGDRPLVRGIFTRLLNEPQFTFNENRVLTRTGKTVWVAWHGRTVCHPVTGACEFFIGVGTDITERKQAVEALARAEAKYRSIFENAVEGIFQLAPDGHYLSANPALAKLFGYDSPEALIENLRDVDRQLYVDASRRAKLHRLLNAQNIVSGFEAEVYRRDGSVVWVAKDVRAVRDEAGNLLYYEGSVVDITERKRTEQQLRYNASHDTLTGLWNRGWFLSQVERSLRRTRRHANYHFAILFLDLDNFKAINDSLGHVAGDRLLLELAQRLEMLLRPGDTLARLGGDEFTILMENITSLDEAVNLAQHLQESMSQAFQVDNHSIFAHASIGIAFDNPDCHQPQDVLQDADIALYHAKKRKPLEGYVVFDRAMRNNTVRRLQLETDLLGAIETDQLQVVYQPIVALDTLRPIGFEALVRWTHPRYGAISPSEFVPIAEESGSIQALGIWVLRTACQQLHQWQQQIPGGDRLSISVNLSGRQLLSGFLPELDRVLRDSQIDPRALKLEITETALMEDIHGAVSLLHDIRRRQVKLCLDDFGTGYCSLNYLQQFPIDILKLDRSFIERLFREDGNSTIVTAIIRLAQDLGISALAEGIETITQLQSLQQLGCPYGQGYWFSRPLDRDRATEFLQCDLASSMRAV